MLRCFLLLFASFSVACASSTPLQPTEEDALPALESDGAGEGLPIPRTPMRGQQTPPCRRGDTAINGGCFMRYDSSAMMPPCEPGTYEHQGQCWRAMAKTKREPTSIIK